MKLAKVFTLSLSLLLAALPPAATAADATSRRLDKAANLAFDQGDWKEAENQWKHLLDRLTEKHTLDKNVELVETTWRHLAECSLMQKNYEAADEQLRQARNYQESSNLEDSQLDKDARELHANFRQIDIGALTSSGGLGILAPMASSALEQFHPNKITVAKKDVGHHVSISLDDDVIKDIGKKGVTQFGINKNTSFDLLEGAPGEIILANITGVKVHAAVWVNIIHSSLKMGEDLRPQAMVTAQKLGFSQSVSTPVPDMIYLPVLGLAAQVKNLFIDNESIPTPPGTTDDTSKSDNIRVEERQ